MKKFNGFDRIIWSVALPGFGQILNGQILKGVLFIFLEFLININSNLNMALLYSFYGNTEASVKILDYKWFMFYPCVYMFAIWDALRNSDKDFPDYLALSYAFSAIVSTIGVIFSPFFRVFGFLPGPIWLPIILGIGSGAIVRKLSINYFKKESPPMHVQDLSSNNSKVDAMVNNKIDYLEELCKADIVGIAVYRVPELILLEANKKYLSLLNPPFNEKSSSIGKRVDQIIMGWNGSDTELCFQQAINSKTSVRVKECKHKVFANATTTHLDSIMTPVLHQGSVKYLVINTFDVSENVKNINELDQLNAIRIKKTLLDSTLKCLSEQISVIDKTGKCLKKSLVAKTNFSGLGSLFEQVKADFIYYDFDGNVIPYEKIPAFKVFKGKHLQEYPMFIRYQLPQLSLR